MTTPSTERRELLARLAAARAGLLFALIGLDEKTLAETPVFAGWSAANVLAHVAAWDEWFTNRIRLILAGREHEMVNLAPGELDARNAALHAEHKDWSLPQSLEACLRARADFLDALAPLSDAEMNRQRTFSWGEASVRMWTERRARHDTVHATDLAAWHTSLSDAKACGPQAVLLAALDAARAELLAVVDLVPTDERETRAVVGTWTLKDVLGHVADWELWFLNPLRASQAGEPVCIEPVEDLTAWNQVHAEVRRGQPWAVAWRDFNTTHSEMRALLGELNQSDFEVALDKWIIYDLTLAYVDHDREHAADLRKALSVEEVSA